MGGQRAKAQEKLAGTRMCEHVIDQQLQFFDQLGPLGTTVTDKGIVRLLKRKALTVEQKEEMVLQHAKLDLELPQCLQMKPCLLYRGLGEGAHAAAANVSGDEGAVSEEP